MLDNSNACIEEVLLTAIHKHYWHNIVTFMPNNMFVHTITANLYQQQASACQLFKFSEVSEMESK